MLVSHCGMKEEILNGRVSWLMFADDTVLLGDSEEKLERLVQEFGRVCQRRKYMYMNIYFLYFVPKM